MVKKLRLTLLSILLLCLALAQSVCAASGPIMDDADLFSESEENSLLEQINDLKSDTGMDYLVVTTDDAQGMSAQNYADTTYLNSGASEDALLYLIDMDNREIYVYTEGMMFRYITDARLENILNAAFEEVADGNYYDSARSVLNDAKDCYEEGILETQHNYDEVTGETDYYYEEEVEDEEGTLVFGIILFMLIGMVIGGVVSLIKYFVTKGSYNLDYDTYEYPLSKNSELHLTVTEDRLIGRYVTHRRIERDDDSDSGRSTIHHASSGNTHGGGGRKF